jgi:hypothetical protein
VPWPIWLLTHGGTERIRTVIGLVDDQVPHLSATVPDLDRGQHHCLERRNVSYEDWRADSTGDRLIESQVALKLSA